MQTALNETDDLFHYTSADTGVFSILAEKRLRLGPYESTNDLRESKQRFVSLSVHDDDDDGSIEAFDEVTSSADWWLRRFVKVACFTRDFDMPSNALDSNALRGWGHPSLWAHYGGSHSGVTLRFSRMALEEAFFTQLGSRGQAFAGNVAYPFDAWPSSPWGLDLGQVREFGIDAVLSMYIEQHKDALFFTKHHDWSNEAEFRLVLNEPSVLPAYLDVSDCITGVFLGDAFPSARLDATFEILGAMPEIEVSQLRHLSGLFISAPALGPAPRPNVVARREGSFAHRYSELIAAEAKNYERRAAAKASTASLREYCRSGVQRIATAMTEASELEYAIHSRIRAVPVSLRSRAAGVPGEVVEYEFGHVGLTSVPDDQGRNRSFVFALAVQILKSGVLRLHGEVSREQTTEAGNEIELLWTMNREAQPVEAEGALSAMLDLVGEKSLLLETDFRASIGN
jgi:hypothetical protein